MECGATVKKSLLVDLLCVVYLVGLARKITGRLYLLILADLFLSRGIPTHTRPNNGLSVLRTHSDDG